MPAEADEFVTCCHAPRISTLGHALHIEQPATMPAKICDFSVKLGHVKTL